MNTALKALQLKARHQVYTLMSGRNLSSLYGEGYDFAQLREYQVGDDIRKINWTITAKLGKPYIKELHANRELSVVVATLMDGGLYFDQGNKKQQILTEVATLLGYAAWHNADLFTGISYTPKEHYVIPPTKQLYPIEQFSRFLYETPLLGSTLNHQDAIDNLFRRIPKHSLLFVIGDFLEVVDLSLLAQKHEVIAIIVRHDKEEHLQPLGERLLEDPKTGKKMERFLGKKSIRSYTAQQMAHDRMLSKHFARHDIRSVKLFTNQEPLERLLTLFRT